MTPRNVRRALWLAIACAGLACASAKPNVAGAQRDLAREFMRQRQWDRAFEAANAACRARPDDAESLTIRGTIYREQGLVAEAKADLERAVELDSKSAPAHSALAVLLDTVGDGAKALEHHQRAAAIEPRNPGYLNNLGFSLFARGKPREAIPVLHEALRSAPADARIRNNLGFAYAAAGDFAQAAAQFERGGTQAEARNNLGFAYERRGNAGQAYELYAEAVRLDPALVAARQNLARVAQQMKRPVPGSSATSQTHPQEGS
jgi:Flp pilus assembly protein TadD